MVKKLNNRQIFDIIITIIKKRGKEIQVSKSCWYKCVAKFECEKIEEYGSPLFFNKRKGNRFKKKKQVKLQLNQ